MCIRDRTMTYPSPRKRRYKSSLSRQSMSCRWTIHMSNLRLASLLMRLQNQHLKIAQLGKRGPDLRSRERINSQGAFLRLRMISKLWLRVLLFTRRLFWLPRLLSRNLSLQIQTRARLRRPPCWQRLVLTLRRCQLSWILTRTSSSRFSTIRSLTTLS